MQESLGDKIKKMKFTDINNERSKTRYQVFSFDEFGNIRNIGGRIPNKLKAYGRYYLSDFNNKSLLDIGTDFGFFCFEAINRGASKATGVDRGRKEGDGTLYEITHMNQKVVKFWPSKYATVDFITSDIGKEWPVIDPHDIVMCCSMYHHIYANCGNHDEIFYWLSQVTNEYVLWEGPLDLQDPVAKLHIPREYKAGFNKKSILKSMKKYFKKVCLVGPAMHSDTREVYILYK